MGPPLERILLDSRSRQRFRHSRNRVSINCVVITAGSNGLSKKPFSVYPKLVIGKHQHKSKANST